MSATHSVKFTGSSAAGAVTIAASDVQTDLEIICLFPPEGSQTTFHSEALKAESFSGTVSVSGVLPDLTIRAAVITSFALGSFAAAPVP